VTIARVVGKGRVEPMTADELLAMRAAAGRTAVDVGTGDARFAYALASEHADWLVIGVDALDEPMGETAYRSTRKPARGGRPNLVLVRASAEALPDALHAAADEVTVVLPWGRLLEGIVCARADVIGGLASLLRPGGRLVVTLNGEIWEEWTPARYEDLPVPTEAYVAEVIAPAFAAAGIELERARVLSAPEAHALPTTWARKLGHGRAHPRFVRFEGHRR